MFSKTGNLAYVGETELHGFSLRGELGDGPTLSACKWSETSGPSTDAGVSG